jgi:DNA mismatch repair ATPase MutL
MRVSDDGSGIMKDDAELLFCAMPQARLKKRGLGKYCNTWV